MLASSLFGFLIIHRLTFYSVNGRASSSASGYAHQIRIIGVHFEIHVAFLQDAPKGYLKLLLLTAASGGSANGEAIQR